MSKRGRRKSNVAKQEQKNSIHSYFTSATKKSEAEIIVQPIIDDIVNDASADSASIVISLVDEIVQTALEKVVKSKHSGETVEKKTLREWEVKYPWLRVKGDGRELTLCCSKCQSQKDKLKLTNVWAYHGTPSIQISSIVRHNRSIEHTDACKAEERKNVETVLENDQGDPVVENVFVSQEDERLFRTVYYAAKSELPSSTVNGMLQLQSLNGVSLQYKNLSWDTVSEIQKSISFVLKTDLVNEIKDSNFFGLLLDESTDITVEKRLSICIRYVKSAQPVTKFLCNVPVDDGKSHTIVNCVLNTLTELGLSLQSCVSLATDGASTMTGKHIGVGVQLHSKYAPFCIQTHCVAHRLNLACTDTIKKDDYMVKFKDKFSQLYFFMSSSSLRTKTLQQVQAILEEPEITIKEPHTIRWLGLRNAVAAVFACFASVLATLAKFAEDKNSVAKGLHKYFNSFKVALVTAFMLDVHNELGVLSCQLQRQNLLFSEINPLVQGTLAKLEHMKSVDGESLQSMKQRIAVQDGEASLDGEKMSYKASMLSEFETLRSSYLSKMQKNMKSRFKAKDVSIFEDLSQVLEPEIVKQGSGTEAVKHLCTFYGYDKTVKTVEGAMTEGFEAHETVVSRLLDPAALEREWPRLEGMIKGAYSNLTTPQLCKRIMLMHYDLLPNFSILAKIALCMQLTSVDCERSFSTQNRLKSKYRASLGAEKLDILMSITMLGPPLEDFNLTPAIKHWLRKKRRKQRLCSSYQPRAKKLKVDESGLSSQQ